MTPTASLPMYNLPEMRAVNARFWEALRGLLLEAGLRDLPEGLSYERPPVPDRIGPEVLFSQTCGYPLMIKELIGSGVAVLVTAGTPATLAAKRASATLPIILVAVDDPVSLGVVESLGRPGGNATGLCLTSSEVITERLELLRELCLGRDALCTICWRDGNAIP